ncbi:RHO guanyl-nucleotide exchange factor 14 [Wolffia australiana]
MRTLPCCYRAGKMSFDFDNGDPRVRTYKGLENCDVGHGYPGEGEYSGDELSWCSSSSKGEESFASSSPGGGGGGGDNDEECGLLAGDWAVVKSPYPFYRGHRPPSQQQMLPLCTMDLADLDTMKEKFARLLLGEDASGGRRGLPTGLALSNAITNLAVTTFGELWKLEPLPAAKKGRWRREMDWLLSPTNYMVELVPATQTAGNGRTLEIMKPRARADVHTTLPALQKLDAILIEVLDSMVETEFWYVEGGSRAQVKPGKRWWLPSPRVPDPGLSQSQRSKLGFQGKCVFQVMKAAKSINDQILHQIPLPAPLRASLPKSGKVALGEELDQLLSTAAFSVEEVLRMLDLGSEHAILDMVNRLEGVALIWRDRLVAVAARSSRRRPWSSTDSTSRLGTVLQRAEALLRLLRDRFPGLPLTFIASQKIRSNQDVGYAIVEAYSRALGNLAFTILTRIGDVLNEDDLHQPSSPITAAGNKLEPPLGFIERALLDQMDRADGRRRLTSAPC